MDKEGSRKRERGREEGIGYGHVISTINHMKKNQAV